jgi:hypothetical protein
MEGKAMRFLNLLANKFFACSFSWLLGQQVRDTLCGTKALWREDYERIAANAPTSATSIPSGTSTCCSARRGSTCDRATWRCATTSALRRDQHLALQPRLAAAADERVRGPQAEAALGEARARARLFEADAGAQA